MAENSQRGSCTQRNLAAGLAAHPDVAAKVRAANRSYVFFRVTGLTNEGEPVGAQGVPLTPGRSIAVDRVHEYGTPFFIEADLPIEGRKPASPFHRLMIAQNTGSAIVGRRRGRSHRRPHSPSRPLHDAASARARYYCSRPRGAIAGAETEDRKLEA